MPAKQLLVKCPHIITSSPEDHGLSIITGWQAWTRICCTIPCPWTHPVNDGGSLQPVEDLDDELGACDCKGCCQEVSGWGRGADGVTEERGQPTCQAPPGQMPWVVTGKSRSQRGMPDDEGHGAAHHRGGQS